ncbi:hypothetical protein HMPREF9333_01292 [Johnsonella ignava ATCC 51276]|uniref:DnaB/C C-terminal domain-containing protein n=1 Tax=Johnsonella ignava ATCC 51276 TaxID=679200 RepID=G5GIA2_9FIRM|nr:DnaD domain protein [Johnsonella ignava]EHI55577.1 hypothetical protein HMPREF9333_01292 [Johnsonella ignava ATCC 51276]
MKIFFNSLDVGDVTLISNTFINKYMVKANGEYIKVYLYLSCHAKEELNIDAMAEVLCLTFKDIIRAVDYWKKEGLIRVYEDTCNNCGMYLPDNESEAESKNIEHDIKEIRGIKNAVSLSKNDVIGYDYDMADNNISDNDISEGVISGSDISEIPDKSKVNLIDLENDKDFATLIYCAQKYLAKPFSSADTLSMAYMYDVLNMSSELITYLIEICVQNRKTSMRYIETVALNWKSKGIDSIEKAKSENIAFNRSINLIMKSFGIKGRALGRIEQEYVDKWFNEWKFTADKIVAACDKTMELIQTPSFKYADKILSGWLHEEAGYSDDTESSHDIYAVKKAKSLKPVKYKNWTCAKTGFNNFEQRNDDLDSAVLDRLNLKLNRN